MDHRRSAVAPLDVERPVLFCEVPLPHDRTRPIERDDLAGPEPCDDEIAIGDRAGRGEVVFVMHGREFADGIDPPLPDASTRGAIDCLDNENGARGVGPRAVD